MLGRMVGSAAIAVVASLSAHGALSLLDFEGDFESVIKVREDGAQGAATITNICATSGGHAPSGVCAWHVSPAEIGRPFASGLTRRIRPSCRRTRT